MATEQRDYYEVLGVAREATGGDIKKAYINLAKKYHPDVNRAADAADRFKELQEAYGVLSDDGKRERYNRYGHEGINPTGGGFPGGFGDQSPFSDIFDIFLGQQSGRGRGGPQAGTRGDDLRDVIELTLEEAATGVEKTIKFRHMETCVTCSGSGAKPGTQADTCTLCHGSGQVRHAQSTILGTFMSTQTCGKCRGLGRIITSPCVDCGGGGRTRKLRERSVRIPAGVDTNMPLRLPGEGDAGERGGPPGDLTLIVRIRDHQTFIREGNDVSCQVPITFACATLGGTVEVPVLGGTDELKIPEGTQDGKVFTLRGRGIPDINGRGKGDQHVVIAIDVPTRLSSEQRELLLQFAASMGEKSHDTHDKSFLGKIFGH